MSTSPVPRARLGVLSVGLACVLGAAAAPAGAAPIAAVGSGPGTSSGEIDQSTLPPAQLINRVSTAVDVDTGAWSTTVVFRGPQSPSAPSRFSIGMKFVDDHTPSTTWTGSTAPGAPSATYHPSAPFTGTAPVADVSFDADNTAMTLRTTDPAFVGRDPDYVEASVGPAGGNGQYSSARAILSPGAPTPRIPAAARSLVVDADGVVTVPLVALPRPAQRQIRITTTDGRQVALRTLASTYSRRTVVRIRVPSGALRRVSKRGASATLRVQARLENGSTATARKTIRLRRR